MKTALIVLGVAIFTFTGICAAAASWFLMRDARWTVAIALLVIVVDLVVAILLESDAPKPPAEDVKRVRTFFRAKGPAHTTIIDPHPEAHGDVTQAAYPRTARIRDLPKPMGV